MMRLPRPASPKALWQDLRSFFGERRPHQWVAAALAVAIPAAIGIAFFLDTVDAHKVGPSIIYLESWPANRSMEEIVAKQKADEQTRQEYEAARRREFQRLEDGLTNMGL
jgi:hypothetical protein